MLFTKSIRKSTIAALLVLSVFFLAGAGHVWAFSVDVKNLFYSDPSPRAINDYDFSSGTTGAPLPDNNIGIPDSFVTKYGTDSGFMFGAPPDIENTTVTLNTSSQVCTIATSSEGGAVLQGASSGAPPTPATSWTYTLKLQNFSGMTDPTKSYRFEIGTTAPMNAGPQPRFGGVWNASGRLELSTAIFDEAGDGTTLWSGTPVVFNGLTSTATVLELRIVNNAATVTFSYRKDGATEWTDMPEAYTIASGIVFNSLPARFPYVFLKEVTAATTISYSGMLLYPDNTPVNGGVIEMVENASINTTTAPDGSFTLAGLPSATPFSVKMTKPVGNTTDYVPTYTTVMQATAPFVHARAYRLFQQSDLTAWGVTSGGVIHGPIVDGANPLTGYIGGAVATYQSQAGRTDYLVRYKDAAGNLVENTGGTYANGGYYILGVADGDTVSVSATQAKGDYAFPQSRTFGTHNGAVHQGIIPGTILSGKVAIGGYIKDTQATPVGIQGATIEQYGASPANSTGSLSGGLFNLVIPQNEGVYLKFSKPSASPALAPTYSAEMTFGASVPNIGDFNLYPVAQLTAWNGAPGKGIIRARVKDQAGNYLGGATVTATSANHPATPYSVCYEDTCTLTATDITTGRFIVKNVDDGDTVTVTAQMQGWSFNTRTFHTYGDSVHQGSVTGTQTGDTTHPDAATIRARFEAAMAAFNANDFTQETGFALYVSSSYLDWGENKALFVAEAQAERTAHGAITWTIQSILGAGDYAAMALTWDDGENDTFYFRKEGGVWLLYGNQELFDVWANSGHQMYSTNPYLYWVSLSVEDPDAALGITVSGVNVKGPGLPTEGISLYHDTSANRWASWSQSQMEQDLGPKWATEPAVPLDYVFTISYTGGTGTSPEVQSFQVKTFVNDAPLQASLTPAAGSTASRPLTFSWGSAGTGYRYGVEVDDANGNRIWSAYDLTGTSVTYDGPTLGGGQYYYNLMTQDGFSNSSMISTQFQMPLLYARNAVTSGTGTDNHPAWSPDGTKIAFDSNRSGNDNIWVVNRDGSGLRQLTTATDTLSANYPSWSPDGTKIAYISHDTSSQIGGFGAHYLNTMNADGTGQQVRPLPENGENPYWEFDVKFTEWLDNDRIAFVSFGPEGGSYKLYIYPLSTGNVTQIIPNPEEANPMGDIYKLSWNAATGKLAYDRWPIGIQTITDTGTNYQILDIPRLGQMDTPSMPGWIPDGNKVAFVKDLYGVSNIGIFDTASGSAIVEGTETDDEWPVWSPGGDEIAFVSNGNIWTMTIVAPTITVTGKTYNWAGTAPLSGVTVDLLSVDTPRSMTTDANGSFTFDNIPPGQGFYLRFRSTGLRDVYSGDMLFMSAVGPVDLGTYNLPADADLTGFNLQPNKGIIMGRVLDQQFGNGGRVGGAVVTATSAGHPAPGYTVTYRDPLGNLGGTATYGNGRYYALNVDEGDVVTVTATKPNRSPVQRTFHTFGGAVSEGSVRNQAPGYDLSFSGKVYDVEGTVVNGARVEIDRYPTKFSTTDAAGAYLLGNLPRDVNMNLMITKDGYVTAYTGGFNLNANLAGIPLTLFSQTDLNNMGITSGKGLIAGRVTSDTLSPLAGARVQAVSNKGQTYTVNYGQGGGTATLADGRFWVPNVLAGDVVTITVAHPGYIYSGVTYLEGYADAVTEKLFIGVLRKGDVNGDVKVDLADAILGLKVLAGANPTGIRANYPTSGADVNGDGKIGPSEVIYILQYVAGLRQ